MRLFWKRKKDREAESVKLPENLTGKERRKIEKIWKEAKHDDGIPRTAQQSIPFERMFQDGICRVDGSYYTKTIQFQDINYRLAQDEDKTAIFEEWCGFLNFFDSSVRFEISFMNLCTGTESFEKSICIPEKNDGFNEVRDEYSRMLRTQLAQGNNGLTKTKYLTFGIKAESIKQAKPRLIHIQTDLLNNFRRLGVAAIALNGKERLRVMHDMFHMGDKDRFYFDWNWLPESGLSVKDFIAPTSFEFPGGRMFRGGSSERARQREASGKGCPRVKRLYRLFGNAFFYLRQYPPTDVIRALFYPNSINDSGLECGFLYWEFAARRRRGGKTLVINPSPDFLIAWKTRSGGPASSSMGEDDIAGKLYYQQFQDYSFSKQGDWEAGCYRL